MYSTETREIPREGRLPSARRHVEDVGVDGRLGVKVLATDLVFFSEGTWIWDWQ
jgi:hypothetical protein